MAIIVDDLLGGFLETELGMEERELWRSSANTVKIVDSPAWAGPHSLQISTPASAVTNLISNPSFETNTTGWSVAAQANVNALATSITRITTDNYPGVGTASAQVVAPATLDSGARFAVTGTFTSGVTYGFALAIKSVSGATDFRVKLVSTGTPASLNAVQTVTASGSWQRFNFTVTPTGTVSDVYLAVTRATASAATFNIDAAMAYQGSSVTPTHYDTTGSYFTSVVARCDQSNDLSDYDGIGIALYTPSVTFLGGITLRFLTQFKTLTNGDTDYTNLDGSAWFEYTIPALTGDSVITYGSGVYGVSRYSAALGGDVKWSVFIIPKEAFTVKGLSGSPSWGKIGRIEIAPQNLGGGAVTVYADEVAGWTHHDPEDAEANRMISKLPPFMWDTDPSRQFFQTVGWEMDCLYATLYTGLDRRLVALAEDWGLGLHEDERGLPKNLPGTDERRQQLCLNSTIQMATKAEFLEHMGKLTDAGIRITEYFSEYRVEVMAGINSATDRNRLLISLMRSIPAHLQVSVTYDAFMAGQIVGSGLGPTVQIGTTETTVFADTGSQP